MKFGRKLTAVFVVVLLIVGVVGIQSYLGIRNLMERNEWVIHTHEVIEKLEHVLSVLKDAETGQRGFVLTGEERYLEPYQAAAGEIQNDLVETTSLTSDDAEQQKSLEQLRQLTKEKLGELQETIELRRKAGMPAALRVIRNDRGKQLMDKIRRLMDRMKSREQELLNSRNRMAGEVARQSMMMLGLGVLLSLVILGIAAIIVIRAMKLADSGSASAGTHGAGRKIVYNYAFAVVCVGLAMALRSQLIRSFGPVPPFIIFYPGVLMVASIAGGGPGILFTVLATLAADYWYFLPIGQFTISSANDALSLGIFCGSSILLSLLAERLKRARLAEAVSLTQEKELALLNMGNFMTLDLDHRILHWSEGNHRLYGFDEKAVQGQLTYELLQTRFDRPLDQIHRELEERGYWEGDVTRITKSGSPLTLSLLWALRRDERNTPLAILEVSTDITRQKLAEESLRQQSEELAQQNEELTQQSEELAEQSEELSEQNEELQTQHEEIQALNAELGHREAILETLLDAARLPIGEAEAIGTICRGAREMFDPPAAGVVICERRGDQLNILAHAGFDGRVPDSWQSAGSFIELVISENRTASLEDTSLRPDLRQLSVSGQGRFAAVLSSPLRIKGEPIGAVSIYSSKTVQWTAEQFRLIEWLAAQCSNTLEAKRLADKIKALSEQRQVALDAAQLGWWQYDPITRIAEWDDGYKSIFGVSGNTRPNDEILAKIIYPEDLPGLWAKVEAALNPADPQPYVAEYRIIRPDGALRWIEAHGIATFEGEGEKRLAVSLVGTVADITERKRAEEELTQRNRELESANTEMESFVYSISHDLRAPIRTMAGFARILVEDYAGKLDADSQDYLGRILKGSAKSTQLIDDLLRLSRVSRHEIDRIEVDLSNQAMKVTEELREANKERRVDIVVQEGLKASVDPQLIGIVFSNLLGNAWKFTAKKESARIEFASMRKDDKTVYYVRDNGAGFNATHTDKMFLPFHRLHAESEFEGTGIGLAIVERIIQRHRGQIWAEGEVGVGATIYFTIG